MSYHPHRRRTLKTLLKPTDARLGPSTFLFGPYLDRNDLEVWVVRDRRTRSGDFRASRTPAAPHRITINAGLSNDHFIIILAHELAHYLVHSHHGKRVQPHGREWKDEFRKLLTWLVNSGSLSAEISVLAIKHLKNPKASLSSDSQLWRALQMNTIPQGFTPLEELPHMARFILADGRRFQKLDRRRTRYTCREIDSGKLYWVSALVPAKLLAS